LARRLIDTNVLLRLLTRDDEHKAAAALALLRRVELGQERIVTSPLVIFEVIYTLQRSYRVPREQVRTLVLPIIALRGLELAGKPIFTRALDLYVEAQIPFADAYNAAYMETHGIDEIYSWDTDFDDLPGIARVEPAL
jgi:predicted nucleic acid-binding protein